MKPLHLYFLSCQCFFLSDTHTHTHGFDSMKPLLPLLFVLSMFFSHTHTHTVLTVRNHSTITFCLVNVFFTHTHTLFRIRRTHTHTHTRRRTTHTHTTHADHTHTTHSHAHTHADHTHARRPHTRPHSLLSLVWFSPLSSLQLTSPSHTHPTSSVSRSFSLSLSNHSPSVSRSFFRFSPHLFSATPSSTITTCGPFLLPFSPPGGGEHHQARGGLV